MNPFLFLLDGPAEFLKPFWLLDLTTDHDALLRCPTADEALLKFMPNRSVQAKTAAKWRDMAKRGPGDQVLPDGDQVLPGGDQALPAGDQALPVGDQALPGD